MCVYVCVCVVALNCAHFIHNQDWWNSCSLPEFLYKWNPVIHDWLKAYVHKHLKKYFPQALVLLSVLCLSAFAHDILVGVGMGFFLPVYLVQYGIGGMSNVMCEKSTTYWKRPIALYTQFFFCVLRYNFRGCP